MSEERNQIPGTKEGLIWPASNLSVFVEAPFIDKGVCDSQTFFRFRLFFERIYTFEVFTSGNVSSIILCEIEGADNMEQFRGDIKLQPHHLIRKLLRSFEVVTGLKILSFNILKSTDDNLEIIVIHEPKEKTKETETNQVQGYLDDPYLCPGVLR